MIKNRKNGDQFFFIYEINRKGKSVDKCTPKPNLHHLSGHSLAMIPSRRLKAFDWVIHKQRLPFNWMYKVLKLINLSSIQYMFIEASKMASSRAPPTIVPYGLIVGKVPYGPAEERGTIIRQTPERALRVTASLPQKGLQYQRKQDCPEGLNVVLFEIELGARRHHG